MPTIEELQKQLQDQIAALSEQRREEAERAEAEARQRKEWDDLERQQKLKEHREREDAHRQRRAKEMEEAEEQKREAAKKMAEAESAQNAAIEAKRQQEALLEQLRVQIANAEFAEEQHRKRMESLRAKPAAAGASSTAEINIEHPEAPVNAEAPGDAVQGTGGLEEGPLMSQHLKHILRQATR